MGNLRPLRLKETMGHLYAHVRGRRTAEFVEAPTLESRAARTVRAYLDAHAANLERAARLEEKAERLEKAGIPSESARNRAERARGEVVAGLAALRASFVDVVGRRDGVHAFDRMVRLLCPAFAPIGPRTSVPGNPLGGV